MSTPRAGGPDNETARGVLTERLKFTFMKGTPFLLVEGVPLSRPPVYLVAEGYFSFLSRSYTAARETFPPRVKYLFATVVAQR